MAKEQYFDLCEQMGNAPVPEEIPIELHEFPLEVQEALCIYKTLRDDWEFVAGTYLGKKLDTVFDLFSAYGIPSEDHRTYYELIAMVDSVRIDEMRKQTKKPAN
jgi:hypothetical protein